MLGLDFHLISIFVYIAHFSKFAHGSSLFMETSLLMEKSKSEEIPREKKKKKVAAMGYFSLDPSSLTTGGPVVLLVCGFTRQDNLRVWRELSANLYELKSHV